MSELLAVTREVFDEVMVPNYAPAKIIPVRGEDHVSGIRKAASMSTSRAGSRSMVWAIAIPSWSKP